MRLSRIGQRLYTPCDASRNGRNEGLRGRRLCGWGVEKVVPLTIMHVTFYAEVGFGPPHLRTHRNSANLLRTHRSRQQRALAVPRCLRLLAKQDRHLTNRWGSPTIGSTPDAGRGYSFNLAKLTMPSARERLRPDDCFAGCVRATSAGRSTVCSSLRSLSLGQKQRLAS